MLASLTRAKKSITRLSPMQNYEITFTELVERTGQLTIQAATSEEAIEQARTLADAGTIIDVGNESSQQRLHHIEGPGVDASLDVPCIPATSDVSDETVLNLLAPALLHLAVNVLRAADAEEDGHMLARARQRGVRRDARQLVAAAVAGKPIERTIEVHAA